MNGLMLVLVAALAAADGVAERATLAIHLTNGQAVRGELETLAEEHIALRSAEGLVEVSADQVSLVERDPIGDLGAPAAAPTAWIALADGSLISAVTFHVERDVAEVTCVGGQSFRLPVKQVAWVKFKEQHESLAAQWRGLTARDRTGDLIVVRKAEALDFVEGVVGDLTDTDIEFHIESQVVPVKREKAEGIIFASTESGARGFAEVVDRHGVRVSVAAASVNGDALMVKTPSGVEITFSLAEVVGVAYHVRFLSDLTPESLRFTPYIGRMTALPRALVDIQRPRFNRGFEGAKLSLDGRAHAKGIALRSRTELVYRLNGEYSRLRALAGIDDAVRPQGDVRLLIQGDDRALFDETISGREPARSVDIDLTRVTRLKIVADFGGGLDVGDYLDLCDARMIP